GRGPSSSSSTSPSTTRSRRASRRTSNACRVPAEFRSRKCCGSIPFDLPDVRSRCCGRPFHRHEKCYGSGCLKGDQQTEEPPMHSVKTIGLDIAKSIFQVHGAPIG